MATTNYLETIVVPLLQKKYQELTHLNLLLETGLLVEAAKVKELIEQVAALTAASASAAAEIRKLQDPASYYEEAVVSKEAKVKKPLKKTPTNTSEY